MPVKTTVKYEANDGSIHSLLLDNARATVAGTPPTGPIDSKIKAQMSKTNKEFGLRPRGVRLARVIGTEPNTFKKYTFLPVLTPTQASASEFQLGAIITIDSVGWEVVGIVNEDY